MARDLVGHNVTVNTVCPGLFDTDALQTNLHGHAERGNTTYEAIVEDRKRNCPAGRFADASGMRRPGRLSLQRPGGIHDRPEHRQ